jgi:hypothetical protein
VSVVCRSGRSIFSNCTVGERSSLFCVRPPRPPAAVPIAASAAEGYHQYRSPLALVIESAKYGHLTDPGTAPFRRWDGGLPLPAHGRIHRYPSVFYSPYQLLALRPAQALTRTMTVARSADGRVACTLDPLTRDEAVALDGCRKLAIMLSALDMHYLPRILLTAHHAREWEKEDPGFIASHRFDEGRRQLSDEARPQYDGREVADEDIKSGS